MSSIVSQYRGDIQKCYLKNKTKYDQKVLQNLDKEDSFLEGLAFLAAKVLNYCENGYIYFVGRSCEALHDVLTSVLSNLPSFQNKLILLPYSGKNVIDDIVAIYGLREHFFRHRIDPWSIIKRSRKTILVDVVHSGATIGALYDFYFLWSENLGIDPDSLFLKLKILAIIKEDETPKEIKEIKEFIAISTNYHRDYEDALTFKSKQSFRQILVNRDFWEKCGDSENYKITSSFDQEKMIEYAYDIFDGENLPEFNFSNLKSVKYSDNVLLYAYFQNPKYRNLVKEYMRKSDYDRPTLKTESDPMAWYRQILSRISHKKGPIKTHDNHSIEGQINFKKRPGGKNKKRPEKKSLHQSLNHKEERILRSLLNRVDKIEKQVLNSSDGYLTFNISNLEAPIRNRLVERNFFILKKGQELTIYDQAKYSLEDLRETYDGVLIGLFPNSNQLNSDYNCKKFEVKI